MLKSSRLLVLPLCLYVSGCVTTTSDTLKYAKNTYYGQNVDQMVINIGTPQQKYQLDNGDIMYRWVYSGSVDVPGTVIYNGSTTSSGNTASTYGTATTVGGGSSKRVCDMSVLADSNNIIKNIKFSTDTFGTEPFAASMCAQMLDIN